jgi:hypothetical protein
VGELEPEVDSLRELARRVGDERDSFRESIDASLAALEGVPVPGKAARQPLSHGLFVDDELRLLRQRFPRDFRGGIALSGRVGSGKHYIAEQLVVLLGYKYASFGRYVRHEALRRGRPLQLTELQALGDELIGELGWPAFVKNTLDQARVEPGEDAFVIDGVRHLDAYTTLKELVHPQPLILFFFDTTDERRHQRLRAEGVDAGQLEQIEQHDTEEDVTDGDLMRVSDQILRGDEIGALRQAVIGLTKIAPALS